MLVTSIFSFSHNVFYPIKKKIIILATFNMSSMFSTLSKKKEIIILATFNMSSANALNLVQSIKLSFGKEVKSLFTERASYRICSILFTFFYKSFSSPTPSVLSKNSYIFIVYHETPNIITFLTIYLYSFDGLFYGLLISPN